MLLWFITKRTIWRHEKKNLFPELQWKDDYLLRVKRELGGFPKCALQDWGIAYPQWRHKQHRGSMAKLNESQFLKSKHINICNSNGHNKSLQLKEEKSSSWFDNWINFSLMGCQFIWHFNACQIQLKVF